MAQVVARLPSEHKTLSSTSSVKKKKKKKSRKDPLVAHIEGGRNPQVFLLHSLPPQPTGNLTVRTQDRKNSWHGELRS
jgi:hypothetical protein